MSFIYLFLGRNRENVLEFKSVARDAKRWRDWEETGIILFYFILFYFNQEGLWNILNGNRLEKRLHGFTRRYNIINCSGS